MLIMKAIKNTQDIIMKKGQDTYYIFINVFSFFADEGKVYVQKKPLSH